MENEDWDLTALNWNAAPPPEKEKKKKEEKRQPEKRVRPVAEAFTFKYLYRRAFSEVNLLETMRGIGLENGMAVNVLTGGDIDQMSYLAYFARRWDLQDVYITTWCMAAEDALQLEKWLDEGRISHLSLFVGEIFKSSYSLQWDKLHTYAEKHPDKLKLSMFRCHAKIIAGRTPDFAFSIQTSANMDTNPRTEQGCIQISEESYMFYKNYLDGIISFI